LQLLTGLRNGREMTIILATHDPQVAAHAERLIRLRDGAVVDDIALTQGYPVEDVIRRVGQLGLERAMWRLAWSQLRFRTVRVVALLVGMLLATTAFTVLTAASRTAQLRTVGTVTAHFVPAYDILVRPTNAKTALETQTNTVQPNFLPGLYGGITTAQYRQIASIPGVQGRRPHRHGRLQPAGLAADFPAARGRPQPARPAALPGNHHVDLAGRREPRYRAGLFRLRHSATARRGCHRHQPD
jgi:hypothetical protein